MKIACSFLLRLVSMRARREHRRWCRDVLTIRMIRTSNAEDCAYEVGTLLNSGNRPELPPTAGSGSKG